MRRYKAMLQQPKGQLIAGAALLILAIAIIAAVAASRHVAAEQARLAVHEHTEITTEPVAHSVEQRKSYRHVVGYTEVVQSGKTGERRLTYHVKMRGDGTVLERVRQGDEIIAAPVPQVEIIGARLPQSLTKAKSAQHFVDSKGVSHRETYYDLPMNVVMSACGAGGHYTVREDGAKVDKDGYVIVAANYGNYPRCSLVETSLGTGKVYDTGGFALRHPHGFDLATDWTNHNGR